MVEPSGAASLPPATIRASWPASLYLPLQLSSTMQMEASPTWVATTVMLRQTSSLGLRPRPKQSVALPVEPSA